MNRTQSIISAIVTVAIAGCGIIGIAVDESAIDFWVSVAVLVAAIFWSIWKNHNFTAAAQQGQKLIEILKDSDYGKTWFDELFDNSDDLESEDENEIVDENIEDDEDER